MNDNAGRSKNEKLKLSNTIVQASVAFVGLAFTVIFGVMQHKNAEATLKLAQSNFQLSKSHLQVSLLPALSNNNACQRTIALFLAKNIDEDFAIEAASALVMSDPDENVRQKARSILGEFSLSANVNIRNQAKRGANQYDLAKELRKLGLDSKLVKAQAYLELGNSDGIDKALEIYHSVIRQLSESALSKLDRSLLFDAREDEKGQHKEHAARKYRYLFKEAGH